MEGSWRRDFDSEDIHYLPEVPLNFSDMDIKATNVHIDPVEVIAICADYAAPVHFKSAYAQCQTSFETRKLYKVMVILIC